MVAPRLVAAFDGVGRVFVRMITFGGLLALAGCTEKAEPRESPRSQAPAPLAPLEGPADAGRRPEDREQAYRVEAAPVFGEEPPPKAMKLVLGGAEPALPKLEERAPVLLVAEEDVFLAQAAPVLQRLDEAGAEVWLQHPSEARVAFPLLLRDEASFQQWLDEPKLGKVRVIQRADGFELMTNIGKLPGADPNGPTVPIRGGQMDVASLRRGLLRLKERFPKADDACLVPSFGTELQAVARALTGFWAEPEEPAFSTVCLVYPRPVPRSDGGR